MATVRTYPQPVSLKQLEITGDIAARALLNYARLEGKWYRPWEVFSADQHGWPADWEGRIILALVSHAQLSRRTPAWLEQILAGIPAHVNAHGYFGEIRSDGCCDEQQLAGHSWLLRGLLAYYEWQSDPRILRHVEDILRNLVLPAKANFPRYPIKPDDLQNLAGWTLSKLQSKGKSHALSGDLGCGFILLDGVTDAYRVLGWPELADLAGVMIKRFKQIDLEGMHVQTHATLTALRGMCRHAECTGDQDALQTARAIFDRYKQVAMTEHYSNHNWWGRPRWTEACAVIDSFILAVWLWRLTGDADYLADAHHIFYNAAGHALRFDGSFGTDWCLGATPPPEDGPHNPLVLQPRTFEVYWCCTMRGGEFFARAGEATCFTNDMDIVIPTFHNLTMTVAGIRIRETTQYPYAGTVRFEILERAAENVAAHNIRLFLPPWRSRQSPRVTLNDQPVPMKVEQGFVTLTVKLMPGDILEYDFGVALHAAGTHHPDTPRNTFSFRHGPLILTLDQTSPAPDTAALPTVECLAPDTKFLPRERARYQAADGSGLALAPIYDIENLTRPWHARQALFMAGATDQA